MRSIELLAPAKNLQCGIAAIDHGADAVYMGASSFGARHAAGNSVDDIRKMCDYAHQFGAKVYATVNTIIYNEEMEDAISLSHSLAEAGVDAILVQDMGLYKSICDSVVCHASTQTDNRCIEKVRELYNLGFKRVVLARELTLDEISEIHNAVPDVELEVFVHGALCVSYSGQCYASQHCFSRSANRGECAQFCRLKFSLEDSNGHKVADDAYFLSLKDQCQIDNLEEIIKAGAISLKIEGRLKDETYVKNVVAAYSQRLDDIIKKSDGELCRASHGMIEYSFKPDLQKSFNRGYTDYFLHGRHHDIASFMTPKAIGENVGKVKEIRNNSIVVSGTSAFANGDGLCFLDSSGSLQGFRINRAEGNRLFPLQLPRTLKVGTQLYRNQDQALDRMMSKQTASRYLPVRMELSLISDNVVKLAINVLDNQGNIVSQAIETLDLIDKQVAQKSQMENMKRQLTKLGGTIFRCQEIDIDERLDSVFIPSSLLVDLRRKTIKAVLGDKKACSVMQERLSCNVRKPFLQSEVSDTSFSGNYLSSITYDKEQCHLLNIANHQAAKFYNKETECSAYELQKSSANKLLMQCRHCIRYSLDGCVKRGGERLGWKEPMFLRLADGTRYRLEFDCKNCQMNVFSV